jgi:hypothetical protein
MQADLCLKIVVFGFTKYTSAHWVSEPLASRMDLPKPTTLPHKQLDVTEDVTLCVGRVDLGRDELVPNCGGNSGGLSVLDFKKRSTHDTCTCSSNENFKKIVRKNLDIPEAIIEPLQISSCTSLPELDKQSSLQLLPCLTSDFKKRARRTEIASIISQASVVGFQMGTSNLEGKESSRARRRHQRRNSVVYRSTQDGSTER